MSIYLIKQSVAALSLLLSALTINVAYSAPDPTALLNKCNALNKIGMNAQNKPQMMIGCWRAMSNVFKSSHSEWSSDPENGLYSPETVFISMSSYLIFDTDGSQYSCVSNQNMAWNEYQGLDKITFQNLFDANGKQVGKITFPTQDFQHILIDTTASVSPRLIFNYVRDEAPDNNPNQLLLNSLTQPLPALNNYLNTACTKLPSLSQIN